MNSESRWGRRDSSTTDSSGSASGVVISGRDMHASIAEDRPKSTIFSLWHWSPTATGVSSQILCHQDVDLLLTEHHTPLSRQRDLGTPSVADCAPYRFTFPPA